MVKQTLNRALALLLSAVMVLAMTPTTSSAAVPVGHWAEAAVKQCDEYGITTSVEWGYNPDDIITRAEFCHMVNRAFNFTETEGAKEFADVDYNGPNGTDIKIASAMVISQATAKRRGRTTA